MVIRLKRSRILQFPFLNPILVSSGPCRAGACQRGSPLDTGITTFPSCRCPCDAMATSVLARMQACSCADDRPVRFVQQIVGGGNGEHEQQQLSRLGSQPPFCERKCGGCTPCTAVQVRAAEGQLRPQCANYEPVGWKCKCGAAVFDP
jgi:hypothetical protein